MNPYNTNAVLVTLRNGKPIGRIEKSVTEDLAEVLDHECCPRIRATLLTDDFVTASPLYRMINIEFFGVVGIAFIGRMSI